MSTDAISGYELRRVESKLELEIRELRSELRAEMSDLRWELFRHKLNAMTAWFVVANAVVVGAILWMALYR